MPRRGHLKLFLHGSVLLVISMLLGLPPFSLFSRDMPDQIHLFWRQAHVILISTGVWMIATGAAIPHLSLSDRKEWVLTWAMIIAGYAFVASLPIQGAALYNGTKSKDLIDSSSYGLYVMVLGVNGGLSLLAAFIIATSALRVLWDKEG